MVKTLLKFLKHQPNNLNLKFLDIYDQHLHCMSNSKGIPSPSPAHSASLRESVKQLPTILIGWLEQTSRRHTKLLPVVFFLNF